MKTFINASLVTLVAYAFISVCSTFKSVSVASMTKDINQTCKVLCGAHTLLTSTGRLPQGKKSSRQVGL